MKPLAILCLSFSAVIQAQEKEPEFRQHGTPVEIPSKSNTQEVRPESKLDREISEFRENHKARNAVLINNSEDRAITEEGRVKGSEALGKLVTPAEVIIIAEAMVADPVVKLYTSIRKLPNCSHTVRILYTESPDRAESSLLGYTIEDSEGFYTKLVKYDGKTTWLDWITKSFEKDDAEQADASDRLKPLPHLER